MSGHQTILICILLISILLFLVQWFRQSRHIFRGGRQPLAVTNVFINWGLLILAIFAGVSLSTSGFHAEAESGTGQQQTSSSQKKIVKKTSAASAKVSSNSASSTTTQQGKQLAADQAAPAKQIVSLNGGKAAMNFNVPAQTQFQIVDAGTGNVLQTFAPQQGVTTVSYTFTKAGNYYLIVTKGQQAKTMTVTVNNQ